MVEVIINETEISYQIPGKSRSAGKVLQKSFEDALRRKSQAYQAGAGMRTEDEGNLTGRQPTALKRLVELFFQCLRAFRVSRMHHLRLDRFHVGKHFGNCIDQTGQGIIKGASLGSLKVFSVDLIHADDGFYLQHGSQQPLDVADAAAMDEVF